MERVIEIVASVMGIALLEAVLLVALGPSTAAGSGRPETGQPHG